MTGLYVLESILLLWFVMQQTIKKSVSVNGVGLHTGCQVSVRLTPAPAGTGIVFRRTDLQNFEIEALQMWVSRVELATTLMKQGIRLSTVEHVLSALYGCGIDNAFIDIDSLEVPILDGSSRPWVDLIREAGIESSDRERSYLVVTSPVRLAEGDKYISMEPHPGFRISYEIDFEHPSIGQQSIEVDIDPETYLRELAFARTFGFYEQVEDLLKKGLVRGGTLENAVVLSKTGIVSGELRDQFEFVRHKAMDLIGDISLCGFPLLGHIRAFKGGHALHTRLAGEIARNRRAIRLMKESELGDFSRAVNE